jgi:membrane protease YdiL (CAAX protease family)
VPANLDKAPLLPLLFLTILVIGGPLGEELGWRGYLLPEMLARGGPFRASLLVALAWFVWHVPLFWLEGAAQKGGSLILFGVSVAASSVLFTWIYVGSGKSLLAALLVHTMFNFPSFCLSGVFPAIAESGLAKALIPGVLVVAALAVVAKQWPYISPEAVRPAAAAKAVVASN